MAFGDFTVTRASTKLRIGSNGLYGSVANNVPAFEFNTDGSYRGLLVEPGATNLLTYSQEFDNAIWPKADVTVTANATTAPDGTTTADKLIESATTANHLLNRTGVTSTAGSFNLSYYAKAGERNWTRLQAQNPSSAWINVNLSNGTLGLVGGGLTNPTIEALPNGWYRISATVASAGGGVFIGAQIFVLDSDRGTTSPSYLGDGTSGIFIWQAQLETGSVATSPIVTTAGTASRVADVVSLASASSVIGQTSGTMFIDLDTRVLRDVFGGISRRFLCISDGTVDNRVNIIQSLSNDAINMTVTVGGVAQASISSSADQTGRVKIAAAYAVNDFALYINGVQIGTDTSGTVPACNRVALGSFETTANSANAFATIRSCALFPTRLTNAQLVTLTTI